MTNTTHSLRSTGSAIAAALVIASTPSFAQDIAAPVPVVPAPVIVVPEVAPSAAPAPIAPVPTVVAPTSQPVVQPLPEPTVETAEPQPAPSVAAPVRTRTAAAAPAPAPAPRAEAAPLVEETAALPPVPVAEPVQAEPVAPIAVAEPTPASANDNTGLLALILGGLAFLALAIWGFVAIGRRRTVRRYVAAPAAQPVAAPAPIVAEPAAVPAPVVVRDPVAIAPRAENRLEGRSFVQRSASASASGALPHAGAAVALPARVPESYAERDALMKRMIAAKPDRANPFTDRGARTRRARLILQSLGRDFGDSEPWIDLSQYPNNWPELARKRSAAA